MQNHAPQCTLQSFVLNELRKIKKLGISFIKTRINYAKGEICIA